MSDLFYTSIKWTWRWPICFAHRPTLVGLEHAKRGGPFILLANHTSPYDIALLIYHVRQHVDFVSTTEVFSIPVLGRFYGAMNAFPLDRSKPDSATVRIMLQRLASGRPIAMFPEGGFRYRERSVLHGGPLRRGVGRLARLAQVPVIPCAIEDSLVFGRPSSWLPLRRSRYGIAFGEPMPPPEASQPDEESGAFEQAVAERIRRLHATLMTEMGRPMDQAATLRHEPKRKSNC
ncbi:MAG: lysophospholipid acyltransferase family protein [Phycisphaeraceae bacterium]